MHRALPSLSLVLFIMPGCGDASSADEPLGGGQEGSGSGVDPSGAGDSGDTGDSEDPDSGGSAADASGGDDAGDESSTGASTGEEQGPVCGDGFLDEGEACDDGNEASGDGCEADCTDTVGVAAFAVGGAHTCALSYEGTVRCFGDNTWGQLGVGDTETIGDDETPLDDERLVHLPQILQLSAGANHTCAVSEEHTVYCWGDNRHGQLGLGHIDTWGDDPDEHPGRVDVGGFAAEVVAGGAHTCALLFGGEVRCWGLGESGQLGHADGFSGTVGGGKLPYEGVAEAPVVDLGDMVVRNFSAGLDHACASGAHGEAYCWGNGGQGRLGLASELSVGVDDAPGRVTTQAGVRSIYASDRHSCLITDEASVQCFGDNDVGQLGLGHRDAIGDDEWVEGHTFDFGDEIVRSLALTRETTCALTNHGTVYCWGAGEVGQLGSGTAKPLGDDELPIESDRFGPLKLSSVTTDIDAGDEHVCARTTDARLRCWGRADGGRLGQGDPNLDAHGDDADEIEPLVVRVFR